MDGMIYIKLAGKESCDMTVRILYTRVRMTVRIPGLLHASWHSGVIHSYLAGIGGFTFQRYR
jgi:hypothetical protein